MNPRAIGLPQSFISILQHIRHRVDGPAFRFGVDMGVIAADRLGFVTDNVPGDHVGNAGIFEQARGGVAQTVKT